MKTDRLTSRSGALMICVLACLLVSSAIVLASTRTALSTRQQTRLHHQLLQTEWLLEAGVMRAARQVALSDHYDGEIWRPAHALDRFEHPLVEIKVQRDGDKRRLTVSASLGKADSDSAGPNVSQTRRSHSFEVLLSNPVTSTTESP